MVAGTKIPDDFDVLNCFQIHTLQLPMLIRFAYIIHSITSPQTENERDFSFAGIYTVLRLASISVEMLSYLLFINRNSAALGRNTTIDIFGVSLDDMAYIVDEMESNPDAFADASDTG